MFDRLTDLVVLIDAGRRTITINRAARDALGLPPNDDGLGPPVLRFLPERIHAWFTDVVLSQAQREGEWHGQLAWQARAGAEIIAPVAVVAHRDAAGVAEFFSLIAREQAASREVATALRERDEFLRLSQEAGHVGSWEWELDNGVVRWSPEMYRLHGRDPASFALNLEAALSCYHPEDRVAIEADIPRVLERGQIEPATVRVRWPGGDERTLLVTGRVDYGPDRRPVRMVGVNVDITERQRVELELRESNERYRRLSEAAFEGIAVTEDGIIVEANDRLAQILGADPAELIGRPWRDFLLPATAEDDPRIHDYTTGEGSYGRVRRREGGFVPVEEHGVEMPYQGRRRRVTAVRDVTERMRAGAELAARAGQQAAIARLGLEALMAVDADALLREVVPVLTTTLHADALSVFVALPEGSAMVLRAGAGWPDGVLGRATIVTGAQTLATHTLWAGEPVVCGDLRTETRFRVPELFVQHGIVGSATAAISGRNRPWGILGVQTRAPREFSRDELVFLRAVADLLAQAVERDHTAQALRASEERYRTLVDDARDAIFGLAADRTVLWANRAAEVITGGTRADWVGRSFASLVHPDDATRAVEILRGLLQGERPAPFALRLHARAGGTVTLEFAVTAQFLDGRVASIMGIGRDITTRMRLQAQLRQSQKMQSVGQLAGGVAHDFNNVLQAITGFATIALRPGLSDGERKELLEEVLAAALRGGDIARQLLTFSRQQPLRTVDTDLGELVRSLLKMLRRLIGEVIELRLVCDEALGNIRCDRAQVEQIVVNLCVNARDAMPAGGHIVITIRNRVVDNALAAAQSWAQPGTFVELVVTDTGCGMDDSTRERIFEPFFTTKPTGKGTGLGLAVVYGIVQEHNGLIQLETEPGRGTAVHVYLPQSERSDEPTATIAAPTPAGGTELILLAEDEPAVRSMVERVLRHAGYRVLTAANGVEALALFNKHQAAVDLVVLDAMMPKLGGLDAFRAMAGTRPGMRALFCSGYSEELATGGVGLPENSVLLQKPYSMDELLAAVRRVLHSGEAR